MPAADRYLMLITSLPAHGELFGAKQTPLSRLRLRQRLKLLEPQDAEDFQKLAGLADWSRLGMDEEDEAIVRRARDVLPTVVNEFARELAIWRLELRTLVAALRRRHAGMGPPARERAWGFGRWVPHITRYWSEPNLRLERAYPWLPEARRLLEDGDSLGLERHLLGTVWNHLERVSEGHHFDFEAVVVYASRWDLVARWTGCQGDAAVARFDELVESALGPLDKLRADLAA
jgi:hypothetical protein